jgi:hypothetical protein
MLRETVPLWAYVGSGRSSQKYIKKPNLRFAGVKKTESADVAGEDVVVPLICNF